MFRFKQFSVDQSGCAMKINTDGVLLGAMAIHTNPEHILDIGTGTGVIALMLAQRFTDAQIDAVEIDELAARTARQNFENSAFSKHLHIHPVSIDTYFADYQDKKFDLIVSNPPFYINSLQSPQENKKRAKHADVDFFEILIKEIALHLTPNGLCWLILPVETWAEVKLMIEYNGMNLQQQTTISSFEDSVPHREIICFGFAGGDVVMSDFVIYKSAGVYTDAYKKLLKPYFIDF